MADMGTQLHSLLRQRSLVKRGYLSALDGLAGWALAESPDPTAPDYTDPLRATQAGLRATQDIVQAGIDFQNSITGQGGSSDTGVITGQVAPRPRMPLPPPQFWQNPDGSPNWLVVGGGAAAALVLVALVLK